jgi:hypothetical protein
MNLPSIAKSLLTLLGGVFLLAMIVSFLLGFYLAPRTPEVSTIYVEQPRGMNYKGWWGHYGAGIPGWGGPHIPPPPSPHPKPPSPPATPATPAPTA